MDLRLGTQLQQTISPQLIQSLKLLQVTTLELEQLLKQELEINPMLEEDLELTEQEESWDEAQLEEVQAEELKVNPEERELKVETKEIDWDAYLRDGAMYEKEYQQQTETEEERNLLNREGKSGTTLYESLIEQFHFLDLSLRSREIGEYLIGNIEDDGYLCCTVYDVVYSLRELQVTEDEVERVLGLVQTLEPVGVGARNLRECLMIQQRAAGREHTLAATLVRDHLDDIQNRRLAVLKKVLKVTPEALQEAMQEIAGLNPKPGLSIGNDPTIPIIPDLVVEQVDGEYLVMLNDRHLPRLRINRAYHAILGRSSHASDAEKKYVREKLNDAQWLVNSIEQRRSTMLKVMNYIVTAQRAFFDKGLPFLKPMILQEVADAISMHPATVSRVTAGKYVQTARGVFPLKYFFDGTIETDDGEELSTKSVKDRIARMIREEDAKDPMSDQTIVEILQQQGVDIARRTVAKYRDQLQILPARYRKQV